MGNLLTIIVFFVWMIIGATDMYEDFKNKDL